MIDFIVQTYTKIEDTSRKISKAYEMSDEVLNSSVENVI